MPTICTALGQSRRREGLVSLKAFWKHCV